MIDFYGCHFEFAGVSSADYGLIFATMDTSQLAQSAGEIEGSTVFNKLANKRYLIADDTSNSPLSFDVEIFSEDSYPFDKTTRRTIEKWLFNTRSYKSLYIDMEDDPEGDLYEEIDGEIKRNYLYCRFINPIKIEGNGGVIGYQATLEADSGLWWQDSVTKSFDSSSLSGTTIITIPVDTDFDSYIYPKVTIFTGSDGGDLIITNHSDDSTRLTKFTELPANTTVIMNGEFNYINGTYYDNFVYMNFVRLLDGDNNLTVDGDVATMDIEYQNRRFL